MKTVFLLLFLTMTIFGMSPGVRASVKPASSVAPQDRRLIQACRDFLGAEHILWDTHARVRHQERLIDARYRAAQRYLSGLGSAELRRRLTPYLAWYPVGTYTAAGIAYTLGYYGIDPVEQIHRLRETTLIPPAEDQVGDGVNGPMDTIACRFPSQAAVHEYLLAHSDGAYQEDLVSRQQFFFRQHPKTCLQAAAHARDVHTNLVEILYGACVGDDQAGKPIARVLRRWSHSSDPTLAAEARALRRDTAAGAKRNGDLLHP